MRGGKGDEAQGNKQVKSMVKAVSDASWINRILFVGMRRVKSMVKAVIDASLTGTVLSLIQTAVKSMVKAVSDARVDQARTTVRATDVG